MAMCRRWLIVPDEWNARGWGMTCRYEVLELEDTAQLQAVLSRIHYSKALHSVLAKPGGGFVVIIDTAPHSL